MFFLVVHRPEWTNLARQRRFKRTLHDLKTIAVNMAQYGKSADSTGKKRWSDIIKNGAWALNWCNKENFCMKRGCNKRKALDNYK